MFDFGPLRRSRSRLAALILSVAVAGAGCTSLLGISGDFTQGSGGGGAAGSTSSSGAGPSTGGGGSTSTSSGGGGTGGGAPPVIHGSQKITTVTASEGVPTPVDFSTKHTIEAYSAVDGFVKHVGVGTMGGTFDIPGVPAGRYLLNLDSEYFSLTSRDVVLDHAVIGRADVPPDTFGTTFAFDVGGMVPWQDGDDVQLFSASAGVISHDLITPFTIDPPQPGDTTLQAGNQYFFVITPDNLIDSDKTYLAQLVGAMTAQNEPYRNIGAFAALPAFTVSPGMASMNTIGGTLGATTADKHLSLTWTNSAFLALKSAVKSDAAVVASTFSIQSLPGGDLASGPFTSGLGGLDLEPDLLQFSTMNDVSAEALDYVEPYPTGWATIAKAVTTFTLPLSYMGTPSNAAFVGRVSMHVPIASSLTVAPLLTPARSIKVDGKDFAAGGSISAKPTLSWQAPASAQAPDQYLVVVYQLGLTANNTTKESTVAVIHTDETELELLPNLLVSGKSYAFLVRAMYDAGVQYQKGPLQRNVPCGDADAMSAIFSVN